MAIHVCAQRHAIFSNQTTLLEGVDIGPLKWCVCGRGLNRSVPEVMKDFSTCQGSFKDSHGNVNIVAKMSQTFAVKS